MASMAPELSSALSCFTQGTAVTRDFPPGCLTVHFGTRLAPLIICLSLYIRFPAARELGGCARAILPSDYLLGGKLQFTLFFGTCSILREAR